MRRSFLVLSFVLTSLNAALSQHPPLADFGHGVLKTYNGTSHQGVRPCLIVLLDDDQQNGDFDPGKGAAYYKSLFFDLLPTRSNIAPKYQGSVNGFLMENSKGDFQIVPAVGASHPNGVIGPLVTTVEESNAIENFWGMEAETKIGKVALDVAVRNGFILKDFDTNNDGQDGELMLMVVLTRPWAQRNPNGTFKTDAENNILYTQVNGLVRDLGNYVPPQQPVNHVAGFTGRFAVLLEKTDFLTIVHEFTHILGTLDFYAYKDGLPRPCIWTAGTRWV
jgi:hypothetical protein